jgi:pyruvate dehydrogenase E2 component (dihydrolipoamide acetyltransferase)
MRYVFKFPDIGEGISEGKILEWYVRRGQEIRMGDSLAKVETDKVVTDIPSPKSGSIASLFGQAGDVVRVGDPLAEIEIPGVSGSEAQALAAEGPKPKTETPIAEKGFGVVGTLEVAGDAARLSPSNEGIETREKPEEAPQRKAQATPVARAMAKELGVDIGRVRGTGPGGRVTKGDIENHLRDEQKGTAPEAAVRVNIEPLSQIRKAIARNMLTSKTSTAHMTVFEEVEISELVRIREGQKERALAKGVKLTYLPFILRAVAAALRNHKFLNCQLDTEKGQVIFKKYYNIGIAVDTDEGLVVPVIRDADQLPIYPLAGKIQELSDKARARALTLDDLRDGTFTVTNYGSLGGTYGVPVISYPQVAILGIGRIMKIPVVRGDRIEAGLVLPLSLSVDHRIVDGAMATRFINEVIADLRDPVAMLLE